jgi:GNAT superfamily N-acetyltransferase
MNRKITIGKPAKKLFDEYFKYQPQMPKSKWPKEAITNKSLYDCRWCPQRECFIFLSHNHPQLNQFVNKFTEQNYVIKAEIDTISYKEIVVYAYENKEGFGTSRFNIDTPACIIECDKAKVMLIPYNDGIELLQINVNPEHRNQGLGTKIINDLYDISEQMNIELYLHPYPDDNFKGGPKEEIKRINRLRKYYERLGFGPTKHNPKKYSNMELA